MCETSGFRRSAVDFFTVLESFAKRSCELTPGQILEEWITWYDLFSKRLYSLGWSRNSVLYRTDKYSKIDSILSDMSPVHTIKCYSFKVCFLYYDLNRPLPSSFPNKILHAPLSQIIRSWSLIIWGWSYRPPYVQCYPQTCKTRNTASY
jgi:hypothetical protein